MNIKVFLSYHRSFTLFKSDILTPIHVGRDIALSVNKDIEENLDLKWLLENMIGDNTGDNISSLNRKFCELTAQYWAWKNIEQMKDIDFIGFCHYRRHFLLNSDSSDFNNDKENYVAGCRLFHQMDDNYLEETGFTDNNIRQIMKSCDVLAFKPLDLKKDLPDIMPKNLTPRLNYDWYEVLDVRDFDKAIEILKEKYPDFSLAADEYINGHIMYGYNIFIMRKDIFMDYSKWLFDILFETEKHINWGQKNIDAYRVLANVAEQLYGIYIYKLIKDKKYKVEHRNLSLILAPYHPEIFPVFDENNIPVVFSADESYVPYLATAIQSLVSNADCKRNYDIVILQNNISKESQKNIKTHFEKNKNISVRFHDINHIIEKYDELFYITGHFSKATYFRFFIPEIFKNYSKVLYLDSDIIVKDDISVLFDSLPDNVMAAVAKEYLMQAYYLKDKETRNYIDNVLEMKDYRNYFNAGILLCDIKKMKEFSFTEKCLNKLEKIKKPLTVDQDVLNSVCEGHVFYMDFRWNYCWHPYFCFFDDLKKYLPYEEFKTWLEARNAPKIIHYTSAEKPWKSKNISRYLAGDFWYYARMTPFYEEILFKNIYSSIPSQTEIVVQGNKGEDNSLWIKDVFNYRKDRLKYWKYKLMSKITFGKKKQKYKQKKKTLKFKLRTVRRFLKEK